LILFHGSYKIINKPDLSFSRLRTDFGRGFYLTPIKDQAKSWANRFLVQQGAAAISIYELKYDNIINFPGDIKILKFNSYSIEWLEFIASCRLGLPVDEQYDLIIGGVANDKVFDTLQLYFDKYITANEAIGRLKYDKPNLQYCFKTQSIMDDILKYIDSEVL